MPSLSSFLKQLCNLPWLATLFRQRLVREHAHYWKIKSRTKQILDLPTYLQSKIAWSVYFSAAAIFLVVCLLGVGASRGFDRRLVRIGDAQCDLRLSDQLEVEG